MKKELGVKQVVCNLTSFLLYITHRVLLLSSTLRKMFPYSELFWSAFSPHFPSFGLNTERYEVSLRIQSKCGKNVDQNNSGYRHFLRSAKEIESFWINLKVSKSVKSLLIIFTPTISYFCRKVLKKISIGDVEPDDTISAVSEARLLAKVIPVPEIKFCKPPTFMINSLIFSFWSTIELTFTQWWNTRKSCEIFHTFF